MKLKDWLDDKRMTHDEFARRVGCSKSAVTRYANDDRVPRRKTLSAISTVTDGEVTANDFVGEPEPETDTGPVSACRVADSAPPAE